MKKLLSPTRKYLKEETNVTHTLICSKIKSEFKKYGNMRCRYTDLNRIIKLN
jgi:hypothetical protein